MENSRDSSVWRSLAVALGDGLAFGVGMALSQKAARREAAPPPEISAAGEHLQDLERRMALLEKTPARLDPKVLETIVGVFEADLRDRDEQWSRRLAAAIESAAAALRQEHAASAESRRQDLAADLRDRDEQSDRRLAAAIESAAASIRQEHAASVESRRQDLAADLRDRDEQWDRRLAAAIESAVATIRQEHAASAESRRQDLAADLRDRDEQWNRRLAAAVESAAASIRQEHAETITALRQDVVADLRTLESQGIAWQQEVTETLPRLVDQKISAELDAAVEQKLEAYRAEAEGRDREIADLRNRLAAGEQRTLDLLTAIGQACRETAERMSPPPAQPAPTPAALPEPPAAEGAEPTEAAPRFEVQASPTWNLPMVSSLLVAVSSCFVFLHWL